MFHDEQALLLFDQGSWDPPQPLARGTHRTRCVIPGNLLNEGSYFVSFQFRNDGELVLDVPNALRVDVLDGGQGRGGWYGKWRGVIRPRLDVSTRAVEDSAASSVQSAV